MGLVVPESYVSTADAYSQMLQADSEWRRCSEGWEAGGRSYLPVLAGPTIEEISDRQEALIAKLCRAVVEDGLALFAYTGGKLLRVYLDGSGRDQRRVGEGDARTETELRTGRIKAARRFDTPERKEIDGAALCFREADWRAWFAPSETAPATAPIVATEASPCPGAGNAAHVADALAPAAPVPSIVTAPRPLGRPAKQRAAVREHYPNGLPDVPTPAISAELKAKGVSVSDRTIDRERRRR